MNKIYSFLGFIQHLDEIRFSDHWVERTTIGGTLDQIKKSRIVHYDKSTTDSGYLIDGFLSKSGSLTDLNDFARKNRIPEKSIYDLVSYALKSITRSERLLNWKPEGGKEYVMLYLGRICFLSGSGEKNYVSIRSGVSKETKEKIAKTGKEPFDFYHPGDAIYGYARDKDYGVTIKFYPSTPQGEKSAYLSFKGDTKLNDTDFFTNYMIDFPYGKEFEVIVDLTDTKRTHEGEALNISGIRNKIDQQIKGKSIEFGPSKEIPVSEKDYLSPDSKRIMMDKGIIIGLKKEGSDNTRIYEILGPPTNISEISASYEAGNLKETPIKLKVMEKYRSPYGDLRNLKGSIVTLSPGDHINIIKTLKTKKEGTIDPETTYSFKFITAEPKMFEKGKAQIIIDILPQ